MPEVLVPIAPGFEEIEALTVVDILRRAGARVVMAGTVPGPIEGRSGIRVLADASMDDVGADFEMIVLPGGALGAENLKKDARVGGLISALMDRGGKVAAICAAPAVLSAIGVTAGKRITSHPSVRQELLSRNEAVSDERVVADGNIITSQGPGTAMEFAFRLVETLFGKAKADEVNKGVLAII
ncbi:MAG: DJ-1/PfpI family protein [Deltaproteobacteria bacterium]|nr:DJ-1/PfpI family protein [Deltaproteobacteria bacterium]MCL4874497.1 DJ-1/PfpI family protein [bacterium]